MLLFMINYIQLPGLDKRLYELVAPLVMNPEILRMNNNYPFKTTESFTWFIARKGRKVIGFVPVEVRNELAIINNYYIKEQEEETLKQLVEQAIACFAESKQLQAVVLVEHRDVFAKCGFTLEREWKLYVKMKIE